MPDTVELLQRLGFGDYEARAYVALLQQSPLNGYELAKQSGLPRANVYAVLQKLEARGAVVRLDTPEGVRYAPVPPAELIAHLDRHWQSDLTTAAAGLAAIATPPAHDYIWNAHGYPALLDQARALINAAEQRLVIALWPQEALALADELAQAQERGTIADTLCLTDCAQECGNCRGRIYRYGVAPEPHQRWLVLVADGREMLAGEIGPGAHTLFVRTRQPLLVDLANWYIGHSIALAAVLDDLGPRAEALLTPTTWATLTALDAGGPRGGWLEAMHRLVTTQDPAEHSPPGKEGVA